MEILIQKRHDARENRSDIMKKSSFIWYRINLIAFIALSVKS